MEYMEADRVLNNLRRQCSRREYCSRDVLKKAEKALDGDREQAMKILGTLVADGSSNVNLDLLERISSFN